ncbi:probable protein phosphatase 2C 26 isoform X1 [Pistacia vera]|uniref:probable protein phosphatase 2C 26 isoform X1 n=1 Tax=Pistacia vera TaxID=55513 RepID=UPI001262BD28|nr:probable protein phosphatase 2C 26 isoform X1 [Pistacia vera]XP_031274644.1 probable protein phosphatase 2C 26 isoform X1 [Pistacia vera]XP_031274645.1 probable protein phosphatase 2C 26 isoform X1 [Pistacia vera]XP_031274646.1 probable protein phosphatase 2C 26 isoform X1 [Pistacia vera]XP_031274647.1 probable protein phosphatase 2C 26 isoform X1 [Pistacia vera]XP_031274649.1 probable protein phosphatase 2C 26 isoform X1 [Pistacia vera]XP_031274650.1 probable protein phosphatase 2C 26 iso
MFRNKESLDPLLNFLRAHKHDGHAMMLNDRIQSMSKLQSALEIIRIENEHPDDSQCIVNDRVEGRLKVTRAFGAGFLKKPKLNDSLLEMFLNEYIGTAPYISCTPSLHHHRLYPRDQFLILSSDGLYQYLTNQEVVSNVESFMEKFPDGDPARHLIEELLFHAADKAGKNDTAAT